MLSGASEEKKRKKKKKKRMCIFAKGATKVSIVYMNILIQKII